jgi:serine/threonine protein kinase/tetratricopeptide (TPR) repeat protein
MAALMPIDIEVLKSLFQTARDLNQEARKQFLDEVCGTDVVLRDKLDAMLEAHHQNRTPIPQSPTKVDSSHKKPGNAHLGLNADDVLDGTYRIIELINEGGMGAVYRAARITDMRMEVAIKVIKPEYASPAAIARFENEKQALANMDHPNIAKVLDAGHTQAGMPYFVMDLIKGIPITKYCDDKKLTVRERLELFIPICEAVQHAHQKGVVHRDLKPSNILVAHYDEKAVPKIIDFGLAKALHQPLTTDYVKTGFKVFVGTVQYAAPEQTQLNNLDIDTRADIYSLGVVLYELLTGAPTLTRDRITQLMFDEVLRAIREEEPPKPSTKIGSSDQLPSLAALRRCEPVTLKKQVSGEIDWIVMKAIAKERARRYSTMLDFAKDIEAYLHGDKVTAAPPSTSYQLQCFWRKHRAGVITAIGTAILLVLALLVTVLALIRAKQAEERALEELARANEWSRFIDEALFASLDPSERLRLNLPVEKNILVSELLRRTIASVDTERLKNHPMVVMKLRYSLGKGLAAVGEFADARENFKSILSLSSAASLTSFQAEIHDRIGDTYFNEGKYAEATREYELAIELWNKSGIADKHGGFKARVKLLSLERLNNDSSKQSSLLERVRSLRREIERDQDHIALVMVNLELAKILETANQNQERVALLEQTLEHCRKNFPPTNPETLEAMNELACAYHGTQNVPAAEKLFIELIGHASRIYSDEQILLALYKCNYAGFLAIKGEAKQALALFDKALPVFLRISPSHKFTLSFRYYEANTLYLDGQFKRALVKYQDLQQPFQLAFGENSTELQELLTDTAKAALQERNAHLAIEQLKKLASIAIKTDNLEGQSLITAFVDLRDLLKTDNRQGEFPAIVDAIVGYIRTSNPKFEKLAQAVAKTKQ